VACATQRTGSVSLTCSCATVSRGNFRQSIFRVGSVINIGSRCDASTGPKVLVPLYLRMLGSSSAGQQVARCPRSSLCRKCLHRIRSGPLQVDSADSLACLRPPATNDKPGGAWPLRTHVLSAASRGPSGERATPRGGGCSCAGCATGTGSLPSRSVTRHSPLAVPGQDRRLSSVLLRQGPVPRGVTVLQPGSFRPKTSSRCTPEHRLTDQDLTWVDPEDLLSLIHI